MTNPRPVSKHIKENELYIKDKTGIDVTFDVGFRELMILEDKVQLYYVNGLVDDSTVAELIKVLVSINDHETNQEKVKAIIHNRLVNLQVESVKTMDETIDQLLSGLVIIFMDGEEQAFIVDIRHSPGRSPEEPDTERVVRGARDGFTENIIDSVALMRRRIRDVRLRNEMLKVGERSKTDVCVSYIKDIADDDLVKLTKEKISAIEIDGITMADKTVEEFIVQNKWNPFPLVRYTERPDVAAHHLLEGRVIITVDTSPSVIILPTTYFDHLEHAEEYRQTPAVGTFIRWIRFIAMLSSIFLLPLWFLFVMEPSLLPEQLSFIGLKEEGNIPTIVQIVLAVIGIEFLRMAAIHTPTPLATALGLIAAVLIGQIAVDVGLFSPEVILYVSISTIGSYVTPSYELSVANKFIHLFLLLLTACFGVSGFMIGMTISLFFLVHFTSIKTPYLWPFLPFNAKALFYVMMRIPVPYSNARPHIIHPKNVYRQPIK